ncbi:MAG TPA: NAD(P)-dependent oxidoreductase [Marmoricola sp.]|nr:NAD(P)-dependent oxidoreductase [Marmoricola sp.]
MRVLVTGAAGSIGRVLVPGLESRGHEVVGADLLPDPATTGRPWHVLDVGDAAAVRAAVTAQPLDAVVHLAGVPDETDLPTALASHVHTTGALLDAMVDNGIRRIVYASSNHAVGRTPHQEGGPLGIDARPRPDTFYGVGKVAAEALLSLYADRYGLDAVACRIGSFLPKPERRRHLATWLSHDDCVRMVDAALTAPTPGFAILYGISANTRSWWDLAPGRALGYEPQDDAEQYAADVPDSADDEHDDRFVGGPFAGPAFHRPSWGEERHEPGR